MPRLNITFLTFLFNIGVLSAASYAKPYVLSGTIQKIISALLPIHLIPIILPDTLVLTSIILLTIVTAHYLHCLIKNKQVRNIYKKINNLAWLIFLLTVPIVFVKAFAINAITTDQSRHIYSYLASLYYSLKPLFLLLSLQTIILLLSLPSTKNDRI